MTDVFQQAWESPYLHGVAHIIAGTVFGGFMAVLMGQTLEKMYTHILSANYDSATLIASSLVFLFFALGFIAACALMVGGIYVGTKTLWTEVTA